MRNQRFIPVEIIEKAVAGEAEAIDASIATLHRTY